MTRTETWLTENTKVALQQPPFNARAYGQQLSQSMAPLRTVIQQAPPQMQQPLQQLYAKFYQALNAALSGQQIEPGDQFENLGQYQGQGHFDYDHEQPDLAGAGRQLAREMGDVGSQWA